MVTMQVNEDGKKYTNSSKWMKPNLRSPFTFNNIMWEKGVGRGEYEHKATKDFWIRKSNS